MGRVYRIWYCRREDRRREDRRREEKREELNNAGKLAIDPHPDLLRKLGGEVEKDKETIEETLAEVIEEEFKANFGNFHIMFKDIQTNKAFMKDFMSLIEKHGGKAVSNKKLDPKSIVDI